MGHLEGAAGIAGLLKVVLALQHKTLPPHLHFHSPSPHIPWDELPVKLVTACTPWSSAGETRMAGVSSFGFSGTNAHVILEEAPPALTARADPRMLLSGSAPERPLHILTLTARSAEALAAQAARYAAYLAEHPQLPLGDVCYTANTARARFEHRLVVAAADGADMRTKLERYGTGQKERLVASAILHDREPPRTAFLFTGQGAQYPGMGALLYRTQPIFCEALDRCAAILDPLLGRSLLDLLFSAESSDLHETAFTQPALFALEYALAQMWLSWGIQPEAVMGHSVGEYVAACIAGVFSLQDSLKIIAERGRLMQALPRDGAMVSVFASADRIAAALRNGDPVSIAAVNGPADTVISGRRDAVHALVTRLQAEGIRCQELTVSHAFHSALMEPMLADYERVVREVALSRPRLPLVSNITGDLVTDEVTDPLYWCRHIRLPVLFATGMATLRQDGLRVFVEIGPHSVLSRLARSGALDEHLYAASLQRGQPDWVTLAQSVSQLYVSGVEIDWSGFDRPCRRRPRCRAPGRYTA